MATNYVIDENVSHNIIKLCARNFYWFPTVLGFGISNKIHSDSIVRVHYFGWGIMSKSHTTEDQVTDDEKDKSIDKLSNEKDVSFYTIGVGLNEIYHSIMSKLGDHWDPGSDPPHDLVVEKIFP